MIAILVGHTVLKNGTCTSADGQVNEYQYNKKLANLIQKELCKKGFCSEIVLLKEKSAVSQQDELNKKLKLLNSKNYELIVELHLNSFNTVVNGTEVLYICRNGLDIAKEILNVLGKVYKNRGAKKRTDLFLMRNTKPTHVLIESFFCDNQGDCLRLTQEELSKKIVEGLENYYKKKR